MTTSREIIEELYFLYQEGDKLQEIKDLFKEMDKNAIGGPHFECLYQKLRELIEDE